MQSTVNASSGDCRCEGTGTITAVIPLADAVLVADRPCPAGCAYAPRSEPQTIATEGNGRPLVRDVRTNRVGEVMDRRNTSHGERIWLRPVGGGREWTASADDIEPVDTTQE